MGFPAQRRCCRTYDNGASFLQKSCCIFLQKHSYTISLVDAVKYFNKSIDTLILVDKIKVIQTKKGDKMAFITGSDETGTMDFTLFSKVFRLYENVSKGDLLKVRGIVEKRLDQYQIVVNKIKYLKEKENLEDE